MESGTDATILVSTSIETSAPVCSRSGDPPFVVTVRYECTTSRPISALVHLNSDACNGIEIRDPARRAALDSRWEHRRIGPDTIVMNDEYYGDDTIDDAEVVRMEPGKLFERPYTFSVVPKLNGIKRSDIWGLKPGTTYELMLRKQTWRWMFEDEMLENCSSEERRELLEKRAAGEESCD